MSTFTMPGFPKEVSPVIDMPDIAELLMQPFFAVAEADTVWKYGTDFQKYLLSKCPLKNKRKNVTVLTTVNVMDSTMRAMTTYNPYNSGMKEQEWHVDGSDELLELIEPLETCHLLLSNTTAPTEFNSEPLDFDEGYIMAFLEANNYHVGEKLDRRSFSAYINIVGDMIKPRKIENNRIYTFDNHIHRATPSNRIEFRYTFRVRETDRPDIPSQEQQILNRNRFLDIHKQKWLSNIVKEEDHIRIYMLNGGIEAP